MSNENKQNRITGTVKCFNGVLGRALDDAGTEYKLHLNQIRQEYKDAAVRELREGCTVEFTARLTESMPRAMDVAVTDMPALPEPTGLSIGYWEQVRGYRCSACGKTSSEEHMWCPSCGAKMYSRDMYGTLIDRTAKIPAAGSMELKKQAYSTETWAALCGMFQLDPGTTDRLSVSHAIVRTD